MPGVLVYGYYYRYRSVRKDKIKPLVDSENYVQAKTELENALTEHTTYYGSTPDTKKDFNYGEKITLQHSLAHLNVVIDQNDPGFIDSETGQTKHQSDIVKSALLHVPKSDYS
jgi:hypothetical protein